MQIGRRLKSLREQKGLTQEELAARAGAGISHLSRVENGRVAPTLGTLRKLAAALECDVADLFGADPPVHEPCPASLDGRCIQEHPTYARGRPPSCDEYYSAEHLKTIRALNYVLQKGSREVRDALRVLVRSLLAAHEDAPSK